MLLGTDFIVRCKDSDYALGPLNFILFFYSLILLIFYGGDGAILFATTNKDWD